MPQTLNSQSALSDVDVLVLTETWSLVSFELTGFYGAHALAQRATGPGRPSGGVSVFYNEKLGQTKLLLQEDNSVVLASPHLNIVACYVRPHPVEDTPHMIEKIATCFCLLDRRIPTLLAGDLNSRLDLPNNPRTSALISSLHDLGCSVMNDPRMPTFENHMGTSVIDLFATDLPGSRAEFLGAQTPLREGGEFKWHTPVGVQLKLEVVNRPKPRRSQLPKLLDGHRLLSLSTRLFPIPTTIDVEEYASTLKHTLVSSTMPSRRRFGRPWFDNTCRIVRCGYLAARSLASQWPALRPLLLFMKKALRRTLVTARTRHLEAQKQQRLEEARLRPYRWLSRDRMAACPVETSSLIQHFRGVLAGRDTVPRDRVYYSAAWDQLTVELRDHLSRDFDIQEVTAAIRRLRPNKAPGPDAIRNEHLKQAFFLAPCWTALFNACLRNGQLPPEWRGALLSVIPKGKGDPRDPSSWRGIAKKSCCYKLLAQLLTDRLSVYLELSGIIPREQHGFRPQHSTYSATSILLEEVQRTLNRPRQFLYAVFIDFRSAFDMAPRNAVLLKLARAGVPENVLELLRAILQTNEVVVDDGVAEHDPFEQTTGVAQGDNLSPLLFSVVISDLPGEIKKRHPLVNLLLYADDLVLYTSSRHHLQQALATLQRYTDELGLEVNMRKTEAMKFRRGGGLAAHDSLRLGGREIHYVSSFTYLGITLAPSGLSFGGHIAQRARKATLAIATIEKPRLLSLKTALALFDMKIAPVASYGLPVIWEHLTARQLSELDRVKPAYLKRVLGLHSSAMNRLVYLLCDTPLFVEELKQRLELKETEAFRQFINEYELKMSCIDPNFFRVGAMTNQAWKDCGRSNRHVVTRHAIHGFHHVICRTTRHHEPGDDCYCQRCGGRCERYHAERCPAVPSLNALAHL